MEENKNKDFSELLIRVLMEMIIATTFMYFGLKVVAITFPILVTSGILQPNIGIFDAFILAGFIGFLKK